MERQEMRYAINKQLNTSYAILTDYGQVDLDEEMRDALEKSLRVILLRRLEANDADN